MTHHAHDVPAGVQIERARFTEQLHIRLVRQLIALATVAAVAAGYKIFPGRRTSARAWQDVIQRQVTGPENSSAILARIPIS